MSEGLTRKDLWLEFIGENGLCGLCGNKGVIDNRGKIKSPAGVSSGVKAFCICPNGRVMKKHIVGRKWVEEYDRNF